MATRVPKQSSLFDAAAPAVPRVIETFDLSRPQGKAQASFQKLVKQIEEQRAELQVWQTYQSRYNQRVAQEIMPAVAALRASRVEMAQRLDALLQNPKSGVAKRQRKKLVGLLIDLVQDLLQETPTPELIALHDRYSDLSFAENQELGMAFSQEMIENLTGIDLGDQHGAQTMDELFARAEAEMQRKEALKREKRARRKAKNDAAGAAPGEANQSAAEHREQAAKEITQSVREVYRKLASALHPDREVDAASRQKKTALMQRVNQAYEARDLLSLLNLQLEIEQIDTEHLNALSETRLAHYIAVLREQLAELKAELQSITAPYQLLVPQARKIFPGLIDAAIDEELANLQQTIDELQDDMLVLGDPQGREQILRAFAPQREDELEDLMGLLDMLGGGLEMAPPGPKSRRKRK
jgi:hypothetical protein